MNRGRKGSAVLVILIIVLIVAAAGTWWYVMRYAGQSSTTKNSIPQNSDALVASPSSGGAPLTVTFNGTLSTTNPPPTGLGVDEPYIDFGDGKGYGTSTIPVFCSSTPRNVTNYTYPSSCAFSPVSHTYVASGTYVATLHLGTQTGVDVILGTTTITVTANTQNE